MNFQPPAYTSLLARTRDSLNGREWSAWWAAAQLGPLQITIWLGGTVAGGVRYNLRCRKDPGDPLGRDEMVAEIRRGDRSVPHDADHTALVRSDVLALLAKIRAKTGLGEHPPLLVPSRRQAPVVGDLTITG